MTNAETFLTDDERAKIEYAIQQAEQKTSAEIVCTVATESGRYDRAESAVGLILGVLLLLALHAFAGVYEPEGAWGPIGSVGVMWEVLAVVLGFVLGSVLASYWHPLRWLFVSREEMDEEVRHGAASVFVRQRLYTTRKANGLLIYVSLFEHEVAVMADEGLRAVTDQAFLDRLRDIVLDRLRNGEHGHAFVAAIEEATKTLATVLPASGDNPDELGNHIIRIHPRP